MIIIIININNIIINIIITMVIITIMTKTIIHIITRMASIHSQTIVCDGRPHTNDAGSAPREQNIFNYIKSIHGIVMASAREKYLLL
jgi:hypothetical protein